MIGERIGNYVITRKLGEGGMGEVYLAEHPQIGKKVALKVLHAELAANQQIATRFFVEAKAVNSIGHPNIVDILDFGSQTGASGPVLYLVMELLDGTTLTDVVAQGPLDGARALRIVRQVADALVASHECGIVHRDLKPDNIMLVTRGREAEIVKLLDFGIAKLTGSQGSLTKTRTGIMLGTPIYMSPEQCEGKTDIDHRSDIYALGLVLYELLAGEVPFSSEGYAEVLVKQLTEPPPPLAPRRPDLPPQLEQIVMKALEKRREDRYATMREMLDAIENALAYLEPRASANGFAPPTRTSSPTGPREPTLVPRPSTPAGPPVSPIGPSHQSATTLGHGTGQLESVPGAMPTQMPARGATRRLAIGAIVGLALVGGVIAIALASGGVPESAPPQAAEASAPEPTPPPAEPTVAAPAEPSPTAPPPAAPEPAPQPPPAPPAPTPATAKLTVTSKPKGASVYVEDEPEPRCKTPCSFDLPRGTGDAKLRLELAGYLEQSRSVPTRADMAVAVELVKKRGPRPRPPGNTETRDPRRPVGDNTLNPFDN